MFDSFLRKTASLQLSKEEEMELLKKFQKDGDLKAFKKLRISLRPLIMRVVSGARPSGNEITDFQLAARADSHLYNLLKNYDEKESQLNTYLMNNLNYLMRNAVSDNQLGAHVPRPEQNNLHNYRQAKQYASLEYGNNPTPEQILEFTPNLKTTDEVNRISQYHKETRIGDSLHGSDETGFVAFKDNFNANEFDKDDHLRSLQMDQLRRLMNELEPEEKKIINEYVFNERSMADSALALGMSSSQVRKVITKWRRMVDERGIMK